MSRYKELVDDSVVFVCDECGTEFRSKTNDFKRAIKRLKGAKWQFKLSSSFGRRQGKRWWHHWCSECW